MRHSGRRSEDVRRSTCGLHGSPDPRNRRVGFTDPGILMRVTAIVRAGLPIRATRFGSFTSSLGHGPARSVKAGRVRPARRIPSLPFSAACGLHVEACRRDRAVAWLTCAKFRPHRGEMGAHWRPHFGLGGGLRGRNWGIRRGARRGGGTAGTQNATFLSGPGAAPGRRVRARQGIRRRIRRSLA